MISTEWISPGSGLGSVRELQGRVFIDELGISRDIVEDGLDRCSWFAVFLLDGRPIACGRLSLSAPGTVSISRVAVLKEHRRQGIGRGLVKTLLLKSRNLGLKTAVCLVSDSSYEFAKSLGFEDSGESFVRGGIRHYAMRRESGDGSEENCQNQCSREEGQD